MLRGFFAVFSVILVASACFIGCKANVDEGEDDTIVADTVLDQIGDSAVDTGEDSAVDTGMTDTAADPDAPMPVGVWDQSNWDECVWGD